VKCVLDDRNASEDQLFRVLKRAGKQVASNQRRFDNDLKDLTGRVSNLELDVHFLKGRMTALEAAKAGGASSSTPASPTSKQPAPVPRSTPNDSPTAPFPSSNLQLLTTTSTPTSVGDSETLSPALSSTSPAHPTHTEFASSGDFAYGSPEPTPPSTAPSPPTGRTQSATTDFSFESIVSVVSSIFSGSGVKNSAKSTSVPLVAEDTRRDLFSSTPPKHTSELNDTEDSQKSVALSLAKLKQLSKNSQRFARKAL